MWEKTRAELDAVFKKNNKIVVERRGNNRWSQLKSHLDYLQSFAASQNKVIRPAMSNFGTYVESMGHKHYIESAEELVDGYLLPTSQISLHILLNLYPDTGNVCSHTITFKTDSSRVVYLYRKTGGFGGEKNGFSTVCRYPVGRYDLSQITPEVVASHLKDFVVEAILSKPQQLGTKHITRGAHPEVG